MDDAEDIVTVMLVEKQASDAMLVQGKPYTYWAEILMKVTVLGGEWRAICYRASAASESSSFSESEWASSMDSGRDWRRFRNW